MRRTTRVAVTLAAAAGVAAALSAAVRADTDMTWPDGSRLRWGKDWYYPDGGHLLWGKDLYYPNGEHLRWGKDLYYPDGKHLRWGKDLYLPDGGKRDGGDVGLLVESRDSATGTQIHLYRERAGAPVWVSITIEGPAYRVDYQEADGITGARVWVAGRPFGLLGDERVFDRLSPAPSEPDVIDPFRKPRPGPHPAPMFAPPGPPPAIPPWKMRPVGPPPPEAPVPLAPPRGTGALDLCGYGFDTIRWERAGSLVFVHGRDRALWRIDGRACHGGRVDEAVVSFASTGDRVVYLDASRRAWLLVGDEYFHIATGAVALKTDASRISFSLPKKGWFHLDGLTPDGDSLRAHEEPLGRDVWFRPSRTFTPSF